MKSRDGRKSRRPPPPPAPAKGSRPDNTPSSPEITIDEVPMGRQTLHAIWEDRQQQRDQGARGPLVTVGYEEVPVPPPAPHKTPPPPKLKGFGAPRRPMTSAPEITITETPIGRRTLVDIKEALGREDPEAVAHQDPSRRFAHAEVLELYTFVVLDCSLSVAATEQEKIDFVRQRLSHRLPGGSDSVKRVDIRPADDTALLMRVWCEVPITMR